MAPRKTTQPVNDWQTVEPNDWTTSPSSTLTPSVPRGTSPAPTLPPTFGTDAFNAAVHSQMLGIDPGMAYTGREQIDTELRGQAGDYDAPLDDTFMNDIKVGLQGSIFGLYGRNKMPDEIRNPGLIDKAITGITETIADLPFYAAGALVGGAIGGAAGSEVPVVGNITLGAIGAGAGAFAVPAGLRQALVEGIQKGDIKSFGDLMHRAADVVWATTKGAWTGAAGEFAEAIPVGAAVLKSGVATKVVKGLYQAATFTAAGDILDGKLPNAKDFAGNAALIVPLNLITHGLFMGHGEVEQATMDRYVADGTPPGQAAEQLTAQPPVKPDIPPGLIPAIQIGEGVVEADANEDHASLSQRVLAQRPVTLEQLEADPAKADDVLENPKIHEQDVIDKAWQLKKEAIEAGDVEAPEGGEKPLTIDELYNRADMKSGRGFTTPDGQFLSRMEAKRWMKDNEPAVHDMWAERVTGDKSAELHSEDYVEARNRTQGLSLAEGDPTIANLSPENAQRLAAARGDLNKIKAGDASKGYGKEVLRTLFVGQRDTRIAATTQLRDALKKLIPDFHDQEALSILRDYKDKPGQLQVEADRIRESGSEREKGLLPSIERAINPSPQLLKADEGLTAYYTAALAEGKELGIRGISGSTIDPSQYSPHILTRILEGEQPSVSRGAPMSQSTPFGKTRSYPTILDALKTGTLDARTVNALDALSVYGDRHATVVATKLLATELKNTEMGKYGTQENHPDGWVELAPGQSAFRNTFAIKDAETGEAHTISQALYVPKDVADAMKPMFESGIKGTMFGPLLKGQGYVKSLELGLSFFHMKALSVTAFNNMGLADFTKALASDLKSPEFAEAERSWAADGLTTSKTTTPYEAYAGLNKSSIPTGFDKFADAPLIKQVDAAFKKTTEVTFDVIQRKFKVQDAELKGAAWLGNHPEATNEEYFAARRSIAKEVNAAYGGLNWDVLGVGKTVRDVSRLFLLAPDWTFSNVLNVKYTFEGGPAGSAARMFWAKSFATGFAMTAAASIALGGKYDPTDIKHIDQVYLGKDQQGKDMYANWFFAGAPKDAMTLVKRSASDSPIAGTAEFIVGKANPLVSAINAVASNKQPSGKPIYNRDDSNLEKTGDILKFGAGRVVPISGVSAVKTVSDALTDPNHEYSYKDLLELAADAIGSQTVHEGGGETTTTKRPSSGRQAQKKFTIRGKQ